MERAEIFAKQTTLLAQQAGAAPDQVLKDIANSAEVTAKFTDASGENIAKAAIMAPTIITEEIAFVTDIRGVCSDGVTLQTT